jgi:hypothetical protein
MPGHFEELLRWNGESFDLPELTGAYNTLLASRLAEICAEADDDCIHEALALLPGSEREPYLRQPHIATLLLHPGSNTEAARCIANDLFHHLTDPAAAPHGYDLRINPRGNETLTELVPSRFSQFPDDEFGLVETRTLSSAEFHRGRAALDGALRATAAFSTDLASLIEVVNITIALRKEPGVPTRFHSSTFRQHPGLVRLTNPHLDGVDTAILTEAIVHESIHSLLHIHEALESSFVSTAEGWDVAVTSPWSGSSVLLHSYLHACFVWYGIYWLWHGLTDAAVLPEARRQTRLRFCLDGFARAPVSEHLLPLRAHIRLGLFETLVDMETRMRCIRL